MYEKQGIDLTNRFAHTHVLARTGAGKTSLLEYMVWCDLQEDCTVVVIDNQNQLIPKLSTTSLSPEQLAIISCRYPLALNFFDGGIDASLLKYVLSSLLDAPMTPRQGMFFSFCVELLLSMKGATLRDFLNLLKDHRPYQRHIDDCDEAVRDFFRDEFTTKDPARTREGLQWRIRTLLMDARFRTFFNAPFNKVNMRKELQRKLVLIDCDAHYLGENSGFFGRYFIAQLLSEARRRFAVGGRPIYIYIDEFYYYMDDNIVSMLETARKSRMGLILINQFLGQIKEPKVYSAVMSQTATKFVAKLSNADRKVMAAEIGADELWLAGLPKYHFALKLDGEYPYDISFPVVEKGPNEPPHELMIERYGWTSPITPDADELSKDDIPRKTASDEDPDEITPSGQL